MTVLEVITITEAILKECDQHKEQIMCQYCPHNRFCRYIEREEKQLK